EEGSGQAREDGEQERCRDVDPERAPDLGAESRPDHSSSFMLASNMPTSNGGAHSPVMFRGLHYHPSSGSPRTAGPPPRDVLRLALPILLARLARRGPRPATCCGSHYHNYVASRPPDDPSRRRFLHLPHHSHLV